MLSLNSSKNAVDCSKTNYDCFFSLLYKTSYCAANSFLNLVIALNLLQVLEYCTKDCGLCPQVTENSGQKYEWYLEACVHSFETVFPKTCNM
jgi:hypothetical protein